MPSEQGFAGAPLPDFVRAELQGYLRCGLLQRGFALVACRGCGERHLVAFSCRSRSFCPSCLGRRMAATTLNLLAHVVPAVGLRQFVLTVPHALRARLACDGHLLGAVSRIVVDSILGWYRRRMEIEGAIDGQCGAVTVVQRVSADLKLNPHMHLVALDGVFTAGPASSDNGPTEYACKALPSMCDTACPTCDCLKQAGCQGLVRIHRRGSRVEPGISCRRAVRICGRDVGRARSRTCRPLTRVLVDRRIARRPVSPAAAATATADQQRAHEPKMAV